MDPDPRRREVRPVTLRTRLTLVLGVLVLVPLVAGAVLVGVAVPRAAADRVEATLRATSSALGADLTTGCQQAGATVRVVARGLAVAGPQEVVTAVVHDGLAQWAAVVGVDGRMVARAGPAPARPQDVGRCSEGQATGAQLADRSLVTVSGRPARWTVVAGTAVDDALLTSWVSSAGFSGAVQLRNGTTVVATTGAAEGTPATDVVPASDGRPFTTVTALEQPSAALVRQTVALVVLASVVIAVALARWLARDMVRPIEHATEIAEQVAAGDLTRTIDVERRDEVGRLAVAFNHMTGELQQYVHALQSSRDAMRTNLERLGQALSSTHDLDTLLPVVLESALSSVGAMTGVVVLVDTDGLARVRAQHGAYGTFAGTDDEVVAGVGVLGRVIGDGAPRRGSVGGLGLDPGPGEPATGEVLAVPMLQADEVLGVIAVHGPTAAEWFTDDDQQALESLAGQAAIAVENVVLHQEARTASLTDALTGLWNVRYLTMVLNQEIERAARFDRSLSVLMLDLDHFKQVNDTYGHAAGDAVLAEFARRLRTVVREVDTVARYGGEEFVAVLPETGIDGAVRLAERLGAAVRESPFVFEDTALDVTVSVGAAVFPTNGSTAPLLLRAADGALYEAKRAGRDRWASAVPLTQQADR